MIAFRNPWQNSFTIRLIAAIDMAFACLLITIYLQKLLTPMHYGDNNASLEVQKYPSLKLFLLGPIIFNAFQVVMAYNLLCAAGRRCEPVIAFAKASTWFQFSGIVLFFLLNKLFLVLWFAPHGSMKRTDIFGVSLIVLEILFKVIGLFIVREFLDDLKQVLNMFPTPQYYCIYNSSMPPDAGPTIATSNVNNTNEYACPNNNLLHVLPSREMSQNRNSAVIRVV